MNLPQDISVLIGNMFRELPWLGTGSSVPCFHSRGLLYDFASSQTGLVHCGFPVHSVSAVGVVANNYVICNMRRCV